MPSIVCHRGRWWIKSVQGRKMSPLMNVTFVHATERWQIHSRSYGMSKKKKSRNGKASMKKPGLGQKQTLKLVKCLGRGKTSIKTKVGSCGLSESKWKAWELFVRVVSRETFHKSPRCSDSLTSELNLLTKTKERSVLYRQDCCSY